MTDTTQGRRPARLRFDRIDKVLLACALIAAALALFDPEAVWPSLRAAVTSLAHTLPFILFAVVAIGVMRATGSERVMEGAFTGREARMILVGALVGGLSPFCSCQVIPFVAALLAAGAPLSAVMAFWLASPLMDPAMFAITAGAIGPEFAIAKTVAAVCIGLMGGAATKALAGTRFLVDPLKAQTPTGCGSCCGSRKLALNWRFWQESERRALFVRAAWDNLIFLGKWLLLAYLLEALLIRYVPAAWIGTALGGDGIGPILLAAILGAPAYLNGYAAVPLIAGLLDQGMSPGAAMAFVIAGGVSSIPAAVAVWALVKPRIFAAYLGFAVTGAILAGLVWGMLA
ncbi:permease [Nioella nitratireducens]|uniref:permease n=1 Tax=Nioella nitratireducens TaxID=1287720 RepID=UPI0008FD89B8|nr:permease [Nioella nitratireducens]